MEKTTPYCLKRPCLPYDLTALSAHKLFSFTASTQLNLTNNKQKEACMIHFFIHSVNEQLPYPII